MELALPRNHRGDGWRLDKARRWRSKEWRTWVRTQMPVVTPVGVVLKDGFDFVIAAHFRYPGCGTGIRPADCFVYPMTDSYHKAAHTIGQPSPETQWLWVMRTISSGLGGACISFSDEAEQWLWSLTRERSPDLSTRAIEAVADQWARFFVSGDLWLNRGA